MRISDWSSDVCSSDLGSCRLKLTKAAVALRSRSQLRSRTPFFNAIDQARSSGLFSEIAKADTQGHTGGRGTAPTFCSRFEMHIRHLAHFVTLAQEMHFARAAHASHLGRAECRKKVLQ